MTPDRGFGIPGLFIALFVLMLVVGVASLLWRISVARKMAEDAGLNPNTATAVTLLGREGIDAAYLASTLAGRSRQQSAHLTQRPKSAEERLQELQVLKVKGLLTESEFEAQRQRILGSI